MLDLSQDLQATRAIEDRLVALGVERTRLEAKLGENLEAIVDEIPPATDAGIPFDRIAHLVGVSRQTLYRWRDVAKPNRELLIEAHDDGLEDG